MDLIQNKIEVIQERREKANCIRNNYLKLGLFNNEIIKKHNDLYFKYCNQILILFELWNDVTEESNRQIQEQYEEWQLEHRNWNELESELEEVPF